MDLMIESNHSLAPLTTFKIGGPAKYFIQIDDPGLIEEAVNFVEKEKLSLLILGGGSNVLIADSRYQGLVVHLTNKGVVEEKMDGGVVWKVAAGEVWDDLVLRAVDEGLWGIENLSHIPGLVGALPVQNVGAYGQQASEVITEVEVFDIADKQIKKLSNKDCSFGYRNSLFNTTQKGKYLVTGVSIMLSRQPNPRLEYHDLREYFQRMGVTSPNLKQIREAVTVIRDRKYPFPVEAVNGNAGSFFKNVFLPIEDYQILEEHLRDNFPDEVLVRLKTIRDRADEDRLIKIPAAFLVDISGLKGVTSGGAKINETQPLVILNTGSAKATDVLSLFKLVRQTVHEVTGIALVNEPELIGFTQKELDYYFEL